MGKALNAMASGRVRRTQVLPEVRKALALLETGEAVSLPSYTVAQLPAAASHSGRLVYCSNGAAGAACLAYSNGTDWLRVLLGAAVSAT